ncbi:MAG: carboxypeptidase regulatory-like domain-containing protein [Acidobacteriota bacterium]|nr:carboxypeptidase regulatory-like domain-containing protein [Acidobacteriota bacterium]
MKNISKLFTSFFLVFLVYAFLSATGAKAAVFTVTNLNDSGAGSLRQAITDAGNTPGEHVINFQAGLTGTINLESSLPTLSFPVTINGPHADLLTVRRNASVAFRIFHVTSSVVLDRLTIANGFAPNSSADPEVVVSRGGGISVEGNLTLNNCRVTGNTAVGAIAEGGGIYNTGFLTITSSDITSNSVNSDGSPTGWQKGGGIYNAGTVIIDNSGISSSSGSQAIYNERFITITKSSITNNNFGGILTRNINELSLSSMFIENSTISNNISHGILQQSGTLEIKSSTIAINHSSGIVGENCSNFCRIDNSIVTLNGNADVSASFMSGSSSYNLISNGSNTNLVNGQNGNIIGTFAVPVNPQISLLGNNGGRTWTHRLLPNSPAINAGNPMDFPATDQRGVARPVGGSPDIGAVEFNLTPHRILPRGGLNATYNQTLKAFARAPETVLSTFSFTVTQGALPPGIGLVTLQEANSAALVGVPTSVGTFNFTIRANNSDGFQVEASYSLTIQNAVSFVPVRGRVLTNDGKPVRRARVLVFDANGNVIKQTFTNPFGYYRINNVQAGETYSFKISAKNRRFAPRNSVTVNGELNDFDFTAEQ